MIRRSVLLLGLISLAGCAGSYEPIIDRKAGIDEAKYQQDLSECRGYAEQVSPAGDAATSAGIGAVLGAALGAIGGAITGSAGTGAAVGAAVGGAGGIASGIGSGVSSQKDIIRNCLQGRGYSVLQ